MLLIALIAACFIPFTQQSSITIKSPFLNSYTFLANPVKWEKWLPDLRKMLNSDTGKALIEKDSGSFNIKYKNFQLNVIHRGLTFAVIEQNDSHSFNYTYNLAPVNDKFLDKTTITANVKTNLLHYLFNKAGSSADGHLSELKNFFETDSLLYGYKIFKIHVPDSTLITIRKEVLKADRFTEANEMLATLQQYVQMQHVKQTQPIIAQFLPKGQDSTQLTVGIFINKKVLSGGNVTYESMPIRGTWYFDQYKGKFNDRKKAVNALQQYFSDHEIGQAILPFDSYLDNKLPTSDSSEVNIQVNFPTY